MVMLVRIGNAGKNSNPDSNAGKVQEVISDKIRVLFGSMSHLNWIWIGPTRFGLVPSRFGLDPQSKSGRIQI